jgi:hypothetical protein
VPGCSRRLLSSFMLARLRLRSRRQLKTGVISVCRMVNGPVHCGSVYCQTNAVVYRRSYEGAK